MISRAQAYVLRYWPVGALRKGTKLTRSTPCCVRMPCELCFTGDPKHHIDRIMIWCDHISDEHLKIGHLAELAQQTSCISFFLDTRLVSQHAYLIHDEGIAFSQSYAKIVGLICCFGKLTWKSLIPFKVPFGVRPKKTLRVPYEL